MGFNFHNVGNILPCRIENNKVIFRFPTGKEIVCATQYALTVSEQRNLFTGETIAFWLKLPDGIDMIGRFDDSITMYKGDLIVGLNNWNAPKSSNLVKCGVVKNDAGDRDIVYKCTDDFQTLMSTGARQMSMLYEPDYSLTYDIEDAMALMCTNIQLYNCIGHDVTPLVWRRFYEGGKDVRNFT